MRLIQMTVSTLALGALFVAAGCTVDATTGPGGPGVSVTGGTLICIDDGLGCNVNDDCCSGVCAGGICGTPVNGCLEDNVACVADSDCCSAICASDGYCGYPASVVTVTCAADNAACNNDSDCCGYYCAADGFCGAPTASCTLDNDPCASDAECCSNVCGSDGFCGIPTLAMIILIAPSGRPRCSAWPIALSFAEACSIERPGEKRT